MDEQLPKVPLVPRRGAERGEFGDWLCLAGIYSVFMLGNILLPALFWHMHQKVWWHCIAFFLDGTLAAEVAILGVWMGLGSARWPHRLLGCGLLLGLTTTCLVIGLELPEPAVLPIEVALATYGMALGGWFATYLVFTALRAWAGWQIGSVRAQPDATVKKQVSILYLFLATTSMAVLTVMVKAAMPSNSAAFPPLRAILWTSTVYIVYCLLLLIPCCWIALRRPASYRLIPLLILEIYFLGSLAIRCIVWSAWMRGFGWKETTYFFAYSLGFVVSTLLAFAVLRRCGFELRTASQFVPQSM